MSTIINATTTNGVVIQPDNSGSLELQTNSGTTALTIDTSQRAAFVAGTAALPAITTTGDTNTGIWFPAADTIAFAEGGAESMRIDSSGNVGIGTTSPSTLGLTVYKASGSSGSRYSSGTNNFEISINGVDAYVANGANGPLQFWTNGSERMRIDTSGNLLVGTATTASGSTAPHIQAGAGINTRPGATGTYGGNVFNINWTGSAQFWVDTTNIGNITISSDYRIKKNIETQTTPALERIAQIRPVTYEFADYQELFKADGVAREGFIAHELAEVIPSAVEGEKDAENQIQSLKLDALCSVMVKAIQEQQIIINDLKARVETLEGAKLG